MADAIDLGSGTGLPAAPTSNIRTGSRLRPQTSAPSRTAVRDPAQATPPVGTESALADRPTFAELYRGLAREGLTDRTGKRTANRTMALRNAEHYMRVALQRLGMKSPADALACAAAFDAFTICALRARYAEDCSADTASMTVAKRNLPAALREIRRIFYGSEEISFAPDPELPAGRPSWQRNRALEALVRGAGDSPGALFAALGKHDLTARRGRRKHGYALRLIAGEQTKHALRNIGVACFAEVLDDEARFDGFARRALEQARDRKFKYACDLARGFDDLRRILFSAPPATVHSCAATPPGKPARRTPMPTHRLDVTAPSPRQGTAVTLSRRRYALSADGRVLIHRGGGWRPTGAHNVAVLRVEDDNHLYALTRDRLYTPLDGNGAFQAVDRNGLPLGIQLPAGVRCMTLETAADAPRSLHFIDAQGWLQRVRGIPRPEHLRTTLPVLTRARPGAMAPVGSREARDGTGRHWHLVTRADPDSDRERVVAVRIFDLAEGSLQQLPQPPGSVAGFIPLADGRLALRTSRGDFVHDGEAWRPVLIPIPRDYLGGAPNRPRAPEIRDLALDIDGQGNRRLLALTDKGRVWARSRSVVWYTVEVSDQEHQITRLLRGSAGRVTFEYGPRPA
ncbi:MAG: hypothetical protein WED00_13500 [Aquisalimonadaceae bacterium]